MEFKTQTSADAVEVRLSGRLEFTDHDRLREIVALINADCAKNFILDLADLKFIDSAGLGMLLILQEEAEQNGISFTVARPRGEVRRSIELAKIDQIIRFDFETA